VTAAQTRLRGLRMPAPRFERLNPAAGLRRLAARESLVAATIAALATSAALAIAVAAVLRLAGDPAAASAAVLQALWMLAVAGLPLALLDLAVTRGAWRRRLRMSFDEIRRDRREQDGDPQVRAKRRGLHRTFARGALSDVARAGVVVANPTHVAVALRYDPRVAGVPEILVRALDERARRVREIARERGIPIVEDVALARALYAHGELGPIPIELYVAVAAIVAALGLGEEPA
jgi:flagellar biosynthetic protein FlhB